jgi:hypothetical protein
MDWSVVQVVERLLCQYEALSSNPSSPPLKKVTRVKWTGGVAQVVEHLLCKLEALISNPSLTEKKKQAWLPSSLACSFKM